MEFGSKFVLYREASDDEFSEEEMEDGLFEHAQRQAAALSPVAADGNDDDPFAALASRAQTRKRVVRKREAKKHRVRKADTNVVSLSLGSLAQGANVMTGDPVTCSECGAFFSSISKLGAPEAESAAAAADDISRLNVPAGPAAPAAPAGETPKPEPSAADASVPENAWACEFCGHVTTDLDLEEEEIPTEGTCDYITEAPPAPVDGDGPSADSHRVVFCIDISGSMCVTTEVDKKVKIKGSDRLAKEAEELAKFGDGSDQFLNRKAKQATYISRLQCVQAAVDSQITALQNDAPDVKVGLVAFNGDVTIHGDGTGEPTTIAGDRLNEYEDILAVGRGVAFDKSVSETGGDLTDRLYGLEETGPTALGPAIVAAIGMASGAPGSKVIICTDGLANVGLGAMDEMETDEERDAVEAFYERVGEAALAAGVTVSVISIEGTDCNMEFLGILADKTAGQVDIVSPMSLTDNFGNILADPIVATNVSVTFLIHAGLCFRNTDDEIVGTRYDQEVGNATTNTDITLEYSVRPLVAGAPAPPKKMPFQVQIHYTKLDGGKAVRVITAEKETTTDREAAEAELNLEVLGLNNIQKNAKLAKEGDYSRARLNAFKGNALFERAATKNAALSSQYMGWLEQTEALDTVVRNQQHAEWDDDLDLSEEDDDFGGDLASVKMKKKKARAKGRSDKTAKAVYASKAVSYNKMRRS